MKTLRFAALAPVLAIALSAPALSVSASANEMIIGFGAGGGYDLWARTVARHLGDHLPGKPDFVPKNMPGAGSVKAANYMYNVAPKDGTVIAAIARDAALIPISDPKGTKFDARKLSWIGSPTKETNVCIANTSSGVKSWDDLLKKQLIVGDTGVGTGTHTYPMVLNALMHTKFKIIGGYRNSVEVFLAMERKEVNGICESWDSVNNKRPTWVKNGVVSVLFQAGAEPDPAIKAPFIMDLAKTDAQKQALNFIYAGQGIGRPYVGPPGLPSDTLATLRKAFAETMKDPAFLADAKRQKLDVEPVTGEHLHTIIVGLYNTPKPVVQEVSGILKSEKKPKKK
jgi:tripartite-type tricarboxylate transporter receptor subunit TctC